MRADYRVKPRPARAVSVQRAASAGLLLALLSTGCAMSASVGPRVVDPPGAPGGDVTTGDTGQWVRFSGAVVRQTSEEVVLRDAAGVEVALPAGDVRVEGEQIEVLVGAVAEVPGAGVDVGGPMPPPPPPVPGPGTGGTGGQVTAGGEGQSACFGMLKVDCGTHKVVGACFSLRTCP